MIFVKNEESTAVHNNSNTNNWDYCMLTMFYSRPFYFQETLGIVI